MTTIGRCLSLLIGATAICELFSSTATHTCIRLIHIYTDLVVGEGVLGFARTYLYAVLGGIRLENMRAREKKPIYLHLPYHARAHRHGGETEASWYYSCKEIPR